MYQCCACVVGNAGRREVLKGKMRRSFYFKYFEVPDGWFSVCKDRPGYLLRIYKTRFAFL